MNLFVSYPEVLIFTLTIFIWYSIACFSLIDVVNAKKDYIDVANRPVLMCLCLTCEVNNVCVFINNLEGLRA